MSDPITIAVAAAVAGKVGESLTESAMAAVRRLRRALRSRFATEPPAHRALEAAREDPEDAAAVARLAEHVAAAGERDPAVRDLIEELRPHLRAADGGIVNVVEGTVHGTVVQARDVHGDIRL